MMNKVLLVCFYLVSSSTAFSSGQKIDPFSKRAVRAEPLKEESVLRSKAITPYLLTDEQLPSPPLAKLLLLTGEKDSYESLEDLICTTQKSWLAVHKGRNQKERVDLKDTEEQIHKRDEIFSLVEQMGLFAPVSPSLKHYTYGICLGGFLTGVRARLNLLVKEWNKGVRFEWLIFLGGERPLRKAEGDEDAFSTLCDPTRSPLPFRKGWKPPSLEQVSYETEDDMMRLVWDQVEVPKEMRALGEKILFIDAPKGMDARPSTWDTYRVWVENYHPEPGTILAASGRFICHYQQLVGMNALGEEFFIETIAEGVNKETQKVSVVLDTLAKCLYEIGRRPQIRPPNGL